MSLGLDEGPVERGAPKRGSDDACELKELVAAVFGGPEYFSPHEAGPAVIGAPCKIVQSEVEAVNSHPVGFRVLILYGVFGLFEKRLADSTFQNSDTAQLAAEVALHSRQFRESLEIPENAGDLEEPQCTQDWTALVVAAAVGDKLRLSMGQARPTDNVDSTIKGNVLAVNFSLSSLPLKLQVGTVAEIAARLMADLVSAGSVPDEVIEYPPGQQRPSFAWLRGLASSAARMAEKLDASE